MPPHHGQEELLFARCDPGGASARGERRDAGLLYEEHTEAADNVAAAAAAVNRLLQRRGMSRTPGA